MRNGSIKGICAFSAMLLIISFGTESPGQAVGDDLLQMREESRGHSSNPDQNRENLAVWLVSLFQNHLSAVDGDRCPSYPTCSTYSMQSFKKHGFVIGWLMTVDRLIHEGKEELSVSPLIYDNGRLRIYDPVDNNDFWWAKQGEDFKD